MGVSLAALSAAQHLVKLLQQQSKYRNFHTFVAFLSSIPIADSAAQPKPQYPCADRSAQMAKLQRPSCLISRDNGGSNYVAQLTSTIRASCCYDVSVVIE